MRELAFELAYERGVDRVCNVFIDRPGVELTSLYCVGTRDRLWRLDRITGPPEGVAELEAALADRGCLQLRPGAGSEHRFDVLARDAGRRVVYSWCPDDEPPRSIPTLAVRHFEDGLLFDNERSGDRARWRVVMPNGAGTGAFPEAVREHLGDGVTFDFDHVGQASDWPPGDDRSPTLSPEQRAALEAAIEHGYYEIPRGIDLDDLAERLDLPRSTLSYRLRRAEQRLAEDFLGR